MKQQLRLISMNDIQAEEVKWIRDPSGAQHFCGNAFASLRVRLPRGTSSPWKIPLLSEGEG